MKHKKISLILVIFAIALTFCHPAVAQIVVQHSVFGNGGTVISNREFQIASTVGQPMIGVASNSSNNNFAGFWSLPIELITSIEQISKSIPKEFRLEQNYPNPFNPSTAIEFALPKVSKVTLKIYDILGREVTTLLDEEMQPGEYKVVFEANELASGVYFYRLQTQDFVRVKKLMLLK
jgi:hypothetical protein